MAIGRKTLMGRCCFCRRNLLFDPIALALMGWSQGGGALLFAIGTQSFSRPAQLPRRDFRAAVAFYPTSCDEQRQQPSWLTTIPLMLSGSRERIR